MTTQEALAVLADGPLYRFADWPNPHVPPATAGVYTIWEGPAFVYVGMAGRGPAPSVRGGLASRLGSHASGGRSGDRFCVYVADRLVMPTLDRATVEGIARGELSFDALVRAYIREHLAYRFAVTADGTSALTLERQIMRGAWLHGRPLLNTGAKGR